MPEIARIPEIGKYGIRLEIPNWDLPLGGVSSINNMRIENGKLIATGGDAEWSQAPVNFYPGHLRPLPGNTDEYWLIPGRSAVYCFDGLTWTDVSSTLGYGSVSTDQEHLWNSCMLGNIALINNPQAQPEYWSPPSAGQVMQELKFDASNTFTNKGYKFNVIRSHQQYLFALNLTEGGTEYENAFRWSHPADLGGLPFSWDPDDASSLAGRSHLAGAGGRILDGASQRDNFVIYSDKSINVLYPTRDEFVWRQEVLDDSVGILNTNCVVQVKGQHFFMGDGDILVNDGRNVRSILTDRFKNIIVDAMDTAEYDQAYVMRHDINREVWFCFVSSFFGNDRPDVAAVYNWHHDEWSVRDLPKCPHSSLGAVSTGVKSWALATATWETTTDVWSESGDNPISVTAIGIDSDNYSVNYLEPGDGPDADRGFGAHREGLVFPGVGQDELTTITRVYPHVTGTQDVQIEIGSQQYAGGPITWKPAVTFTPGTDRKIEVRSTGALHCWRVSATNDGTFAMSGMDFEYERAGRR